MGPAHVGMAQRKRPAWSRRSLSLTEAPRRARKAATPMANTPEWLVCEDVDGDRTFVFHATEPRFLCEVYDEGEAGSHKVAYRMQDGRTVGGFIWYDGTDGAGADTAALGKQAALALETYEDNLEADFADEEY